MAKQQPKELPVLKRLIGGLNTDAADNDMPPNDFRDGVDIIDYNPRQPKEKAILQPANNTGLAYDIGEVTAKVQKKYRVTIELVNGSGNYDIDFSLALPYAYSTPITVIYIDGDGGIAFLADFDAEVATYPELVGTLITLISQSLTTLTFDVVFVYYSYGDYILSAVADLGSITCEPRNDAISADKLGRFYPLEFTNVNSKEQVWATTNRNAPTELTGIAGTIFSGFLYVTSPTANYWEDGEEVFVYGTGISAYVCLTQLAPTTYVFAGSADPLTSAATFPAIDYTIVRYSRTLSIIGEASKNYLSGVWDYTELVRSINLNFRTYKQIQAYGSITNNGYIYNWTDYLNQIKRLLYFGSITNQGFLTTYNTDAIYSLDTIGQESCLQTGVNTSKVTLTVAQSSYGVSIQGTKPEANYAAFVRFRTTDGGLSAFSKPSNVCWLHSQDLETHTYGLNSGKSLQVLVEQIPTDLFVAVQIAIVEFSAGAFISYFLPEQPINGNSSLTVIDTGLNSLQYAAFDGTTLLEQIPFIFENAKSILPYTNYELAANVNLYSEYDLTEWAQTIALSVTSRYINTDTTANMTDTLVFQQSAAYWFKGQNDPQNCDTRHTSYMPNDTYRFCVFIDWKNGTPTSTYWIDDVLINAGNDCTINVAGGLKLIQYYIEATGIDLNYVLPDGKLLRDVVKDIRFGRAICNNVVQATGVGILGSRPLGVGVEYYPTDAWYTGISDPWMVKDRIYFISPDLQNTTGQINYDAADKLIGADVDTIDTNTLGGSTYYVEGLISAAATYSAGIGVSEFASLGLGALNSTMNLTDPSPTTTTPWRGGIVIKLASEITGNDISLQNIYYIKPITGDVYPASPQNTKFFVLPQDNWFDINTHDSNTIYSIYGGDCFIQKQYYKLREQSDADAHNAMLGFWSFNRTNATLRSGAFPDVNANFYLHDKYLTGTDFNGDAYTYDATFTPKYPFQNQLAFNPALPQTTKLGSSIFYSGAGVSYDYAGGQRFWLPLDRKDLEATYGDIVHMEVLLGFSETNLLIVWQSQRTTAQYFDNTANIVSNSGQLLIGTGEILARKGVDFTEYGCEHKWTIRKGQNQTGKDVVYWACFRKGAIMRLGADGTSDIVGNIFSLINNKTFLAGQNEYNNADTPADNLGSHAVWVNETKEYILTLRLCPLASEGTILGESIVWQTGEFRTSTEVWGFENFPVYYESLIDDNYHAVPNPLYWTPHNTYEDEVFQFMTLVFNENDNVFKAFRTFLPRIYGAFNNTYVSSHPVYPNLIYEHNKNLNEALYYSVETTTAVTATTDPALFRINGTGIESTFPSPFAPADHEKYIVTIDGKNYEVIGTGTNYLQMANVDADDILPQVTIPNFAYSIVNSQDPYIDAVINEYGQSGKYVNLGLKTGVSTDAIMRTEYEGVADGRPVNTQSFTLKAEEELYNGNTNVNIKCDTTNSPTDNTQGIVGVEGSWFYFKQIWRWGKNLKLIQTIISALEIVKTK